MKELLARLQATRPYRAWERYTEYHGNLLAGGIAYVALFSVGAALVVGFTVLGSVLGRNNDLRDEVVAAVDEQLPGLLDVGSGGGLVAPADLFGTDATSWTGLLALLLALYTGVNWLDAVRQSVRRVFGCDRDETFIALKKVKDVGVLATLGLSVLLSAVLSVVVSSSAGWLLGLVGLEEGAVGRAVLRALAVLVVLAVDTLILMVVFRLLSGLDLSWRHLRTGALVGAVGIGLLKLFGGLLLGRVGGSNPLLAGSAVLVGLLLWMNLLSRVTLLAAAWAATAVEDDEEAAARLARSRRRRQPPERHPQPIGPRDVMAPSFGQRSQDRTTLAAGAVLGALLLTSARVAAGGLRSARDALRHTED